jgi:hypothetical protein
MLFTVKMKEKREGGRYLLLFVFAQQPSHVTSGSASYNKIEALFRHQINHITKLESLPVFKAAFEQSFTSANICSAFRGVGLVTIQLPRRAIMQMSRPQHLSGLCASQSAIHVAAS